MEKDLIAEVNVPSLFWGINLFELYSDSTEMASRSYMRRYVELLHFDVGIGDVYSRCSPRYIN